MNIEKLKIKIESLKTEDAVFLEKTDERLSSIAGLAQNSKFSELNPLCEEMFEENAFDIRILNFYLYSSFLDLEVTGLGDIISLLNILLGDESDKIGPKAKKATHVLKSSVWLCNQVHSFIHFHQQNVSDKWNDWLEIEDLEAKLEETIAYCLDLEAFFPEDQKKNKALLEATAKLKNILQELSAQSLQIKKDIERIKQEAAAEESSSISVKDIEQDSNLADDTKALEPLKSSFSNEMSGPLLELHQKLDAFKMLIAKKDLAKASLVANDISQIIENFDPRVYFPELFTDYYKLLNRNIDEISGHWSNRGSVIWNTMEDLYKIDLNSFISMDD